MVKSKKKSQDSSTKSVKLGNQTISFGIVGILVIGVIGITGLAMFSSRMSARASGYTPIVNNPEKTVTLYACKERAPGAQFKINSKLVNNSKLYWASYGGSDLSNGNLAVNVAPGTTGYSAFSPLVSKKAVLSFSIFLNIDINGYKSGPIDINKIKGC